MKNQALFEKLKPGDRRTLVKRLKAGTHTLSGIDYKVPRALLAKVTEEYVNRGGWSGWEDRIVDIENAVLAPTRLRLFWRWITRQEIIPRATVITDGEGV